MTIINKGLYENIVGHVPPEIAERIKVSLETDLELTRMFEDFRIHIMDSKVIDSKAVQLLMFGMTSARPISARIRYHAVAGLALLAVGIRSYNESGPLLQRPTAKIARGTDMSQHTYPYLTLAERQKKPRKVGRTLVQDKGASLADMKNALETTGPYIDYYKPSSIYHAIYPEEFTFRKIEMLKEHDIKPFMGGNVAELAYAQGTIEEHLAYTKDHGWEATEISETYISFPEDLKLDLIKRCADDGLEVFYEWGSKSPTKPLVPEEAAEDICRYLEVGVSVAILEEGEVNMLIGKDGEGDYPGRLKKLFDLVGPENLMVESNELKQIGWFMREMGTVVNIGNLNYNQVADIEPLRYGIGRAVDYAIYDPFLNKGQDML